MVKPMPGPISPVAGGKTPGGYSRYRRYRRVAMQEPVFLQVADWPHPQAMSQDISYGGICLRMPHEVAPGDRLAFGVDRPGGESFELHGEVCYVRDVDGGEFVVGLRWLQLNEEVFGLIQALVDEIADATNDDSE